MKTLQSNTEMLSFEELMQVRGGDNPPQQCSEGTPAIIVCIPGPAINQGEISNTNN